VAPGATYGPAKRWSAPGFAQVARTLALEHGWRVVVVGGEGDRAPAAAVTAALRVAEGPTVVDLAGTTTVQELAAVLAGARLVIANDSGPMHLAAAVGAPLVGLFGSTEPGWTAPLGGIAVTTEPRPACAPCFERTCDVGYVCLTELDPARVVEASERALAAAGTATSEHPSGDG
jgi:heptosyltransferase-2